MYCKRLLQFAFLAIMTGQPGFVHSQNYQPTGDGGLGHRRVSQRFSLPQQATRPPLFVDQQHNDYTAMSPDSWGHPASRQSMSQAMPGASPTLAHPNSRRTTPIVNQPSSIGTTIALSQDNVAQPTTAPAPESRAPSQFSALTNTGVRSTGGPTDARNTSSSFAQVHSSRPDNDRQTEFQNAKFTRTQDDKEDFPDLLPGTDVDEDADDVPFPFTRRKRSEATAGSDPAVPTVPTQPTVPPLDPLTPSGQSVVVLPSDANEVILPGLDTVEPVREVQPQRSFYPVALQPMVSSVGQPMTGQYPTARSTGPVIPLQQPATQPFMQPLYAPVPVEPQNGSRQHRVGFDYPQQTAWQPPGAALLQTEPQVQRVPNWASMIQTPQTEQFSQTGQSPQQNLPTYRPDLGHRDVMPTIRNRPIRDDGKKFEHETKKRDYPPFKEIIATGKFFYNADLNALRPSFLGNTGISLDSPDFSQSEAFDFDTSYSPMVKFGFESPYGPGVELSYFNISTNSNTLSAVNDGISSVASIASVTGPGRLSRLGTDAAGETLTANHSFELETFGLNFFKELKFPISRLNGKFGFMYANVAQSLLADVRDARGNVTGGMSNTTDFRGYGPQFALEYFRPVGHTPLTLVTSFGGKGLFGRRDQFLNNDSDSVSRRFGADEFITVIDFTGGIQMKKMVADGRYWTARVGYVHQAWLGGGTAVDPQGDFGINGFAFGIGYNR